MCAGLSAQRLRVGRRIGAPLISCNCYFHARPPREEPGHANRTVLGAIPSCGASPAVIVVGVGLDVDTAVSALDLLAAGGFVERCTRGWRIRRLGQRPTRRS
jgi:hypothetical protein